VWPAIFLVLAPRRRTLVLVIVAIIVVASLARDTTGVLQRADALLAGGLLAVIRPRIPWPVGIAGWVVVVACATSPGQVDGGLRTVTTLGSVAVVGASRLAPRPLVRLGTISYGLYLWSYPIGAVVLYRTADPLAHAVWTVGGILATVGIALISERYVERRWRVRRPEAGLERPETGVPSLRAALASHWLSAAPMPPARAPISEVD